MLCGKPWHTLRSIGPTDPDHALVTDAHAAPVATSLSRLMAPVHAKSRAARVFPGHGSVWVRPPSSCPIVAGGKSGGFVPETTSRPNRPNHNRDGNPDSIEDCGSMELDRHKGPAHSRMHHHNMERSRRRSTGTRSRRRSERQRPMRRRPPIQHESHPGRRAIRRNALEPGHCSAPPDWQLRIRK